MFISNVEKPLKLQTKQYEKTFGQDSFIEDNVKPFPY
jgi:hypothetical protein